MQYKHNAAASIAVIKLTAGALQMEFQEYTQFIGQREKN
jgi:hypothetical protein